VAVSFVKHRGHMHLICSIIFSLFIHHLLFPPSLLSHLERSSHGRLKALAFEWDDPRAVDLFLDQDRVQVTKILHLFREHYIKYIRSWVSLPVYL
jgi:hypothetical protein